MSFYDSVQYYTTLFHPGQIKGSTENDQNGEDEADCKIAKLLK